MSARSGQRGLEPRLQVAALDRLHLAVDGRALCGRVIVDELDVYSDEAGLSAWNCGPLQRCAQCSATLVARIRQPSQRAAAAVHETVRYEDLRPGDVIDVHVLVADHIGWEWEQREVVSVDGRTVRLRDGEREYEIDTDKDRNRPLRWRAPAATRARR